MNQPPLTLHENRSFPKKGRLSQSDRGLNLSERLINHPVARLSRAFAQTGQERSVSDLVQIRQAPGQLAPTFSSDSFNRPTLTCPQDMPLSDLVVFLHGHFCQSHLPPIREKLSPFGQGLLDHLVEQASGTWRRFTIGIVKPMQTDRHGPHTYWFDRSFGRMVTLDPNAPDTEIMHLFPHMTLDFQTRLERQNFLWKNYAPNTGCPRNVRAARLQDMQILIDEALPIITYVPGHKKSFLEGNSVQDTLVGMMERVSRPGGKLLAFPVSYTPKAKKPGPRGHLRLVHSEP